MGPDGRRTTVRTSSRTRARRSTPATRWLPYSERPITARFAAEAYPILDPAGGPYNPSGQLTDLYAMGGQGNLVYEAPPDPQTNVIPAARPPAPDPVMELIR